MRFCAVAALALCLCACGGSYTTVFDYAGTGSGGSQRLCGGYGSYLLTGGAESLRAGKAETHRRLAVEYRRAGNPESRLLSIREIDAALEPGAYLLVVEFEDLIARRRVAGERGFVVTG